MRRKKSPKSKVETEVIRLEDLAPRGDVQGGAGRLLFGERVEPPPARETPEERQGEDTQRRGRGKA